MDIVFEAEGERKRERERREINFREYADYWQWSRARSSFCFVLAADRCCR